MSYMNSSDFPVSDYANLAAPNDNVSLWGGGPTCNETEGGSHQGPYQHQPHNLNTAHAYNHINSPHAHLTSNPQYYSPSPSQNSPYPNTPYEGYVAQFPNEYPLPSLPPNQPSHTPGRDNARYPHHAGLNRAPQPQQLVQGSASPSAASPNVHANIHPEVHLDGGRHLRVPSFSHWQVPQQSPDSVCRRHLRITTTGHDHLSTQAGARRSPGLPSTTTNSPISSLLHTPPAPWAEPAVGTFSVEARHLNSALTQSSRSHPTTHTFLHQQPPPPPFIAPVPLNYPSILPDDPFSLYSLNSNYLMEPTKDDTSPNVSNHAMEMSLGESLKTHPPHILSATTAVVTSPTRIEHALQQEAQQGPPPSSHPSLANLPPNAPVGPAVSVVATTTIPTSVVTPNFNNSPHLSGYRTTIRSTDLTPVNAPPKARSYKIKSATSHKDAMPMTPLASPDSVATPGLRKRNADDAELSEMDMDTDSRGTPADTVLVPVLGALGQLGSAKTAEEIKREKNRESQRRSRQRKHQTLENYQTDIERLMREKEDLRHQLSRERDEWKDRALKAEARLPLLPQSALTDPSPPAPTAA